MIIKFLIIMAIIIAVGGVVWGIVIPLKHRSKGNRIYAAFFAKNGGAQQGLQGQPLAFATRKGIFIVTALMLLWVCFATLALMYYGGLLFSHKPATAAALALVVVILGLIAAMTDKWFAVFYVYQNGIEWRSPFRAKQFYFNELDELYLGYVYGMRATVVYDAYEFRYDNKKLIVLPVSIYANIAYLEEIFTTDNPWVTHVVEKRPD